MMIFIGRVKAQPALCVIRVIAVVAKPGVGQKQVQDLSRDISIMTQILGKLLKERLIALC